MSHWTSSVKHKMKDKMIENFKMAGAEHETQQGPFSKGTLVCVHSTGATRQSLREGQAVFAQAERGTEGILGSRRGFTKDEKVGILLAELGERREGLVRGGASCWLVSHEKLAGRVRREADILKPSLALALGLLSRDGVTHEPFLGLKSGFPCLQCVPALLLPRAFHTGLWFSVRWEPIPLDPKLFRKEAGVILYSRTYFKVPDIRT